MPTFQDMVRQKPQHVGNEDRRYETKASEEVKLVESEESCLEPNFNSNRKNISLKIDSQNSITKDEDDNFEAKPGSIKSIMERLQASYMRSVGLGSTQKPTQGLRNSTDFGQSYKDNEYALIQGLYGEFKRLSHREIFMYIMDTRDEIMRSKHDYNNLSTDYANAKTELVMLKKYYQDSSPLKHSKQKFDTIQKDYNILKKEAECLRSYNQSLKEEVSNLTKSLLKSNEVITTVLTEIQKGSKNSMVSLHKLIHALENKMQHLIQSYEKSWVTIDQDPNMILNSVDEINVDRASPKDVLQDTHVFLKQAMDTLRNSSRRMKGLLEPVDEDANESHDLISHNQQKFNFRTCDRDNEKLSGYGRQLDDSRWVKSFDYDVRHHRDRSKNSAKETSRSRSPAIYANAKNNKNNYKSQAEDFSSRAQLRSKLCVV